MLLLLLLLLLQATSTAAAVSAASGSAGAAGSEAVGSQLMIRVKSDKKLEPKNFLKLPGSRGLMLQTELRAELDDGVLPSSSLPACCSRAVCVSTTVYRSLKLLRSKATGAVR